ARAQPPPPSGPRSSPSSGTPSRGARRARREPIPRAPPASLPSQSRASRTSGLPAPPFPRPTTPAPSSRSCAGRTARYSSDGARSGGVRRGWSRCPSRSTRATSPSVRPSPPSSPRGPQGAPPVGRDDGAASVVPALLGSYRVTVDGQIETRVAAPDPRELDFRPRPVGSAAPEATVGERRAAVDVSGEVALALLALTAFEMALRLWTSARDARAARATTLAMRLPDEA